jgi:hypothetical protein
LNASASYKTECEQGYQQLLSEKKAQESKVLELYSAAQKSLELSKQKILADLDTKY